jgi:hypothetical protein
LTHRDANGHSATMKVPVEIHANLSHACPPFGVL